MKCPMCNEAELVHPAGPEWSQCPECRVFGSVALFEKIETLRNDIDNLGHELRIQGEFD